MNVKLLRVLPWRTNLASFFNNIHFLKKIPVGSFEKSVIFFHSIRFLFIVKLKFFFNSWCSILDYFILNCKLWDKFLISMIIFLLILYILNFYWNFEWIFEFMALKRAPICGRNVCLFFFSFCAFLNLIIIILMKENKKKLPLCQRNEQNFYEYGSIQ